MKERLPAIIALLLLGILVLASWWATHYTQLAEETALPRRLTHEIDTWARHFVMLRTDDDGKPINRLEGIYGEHYPDDDAYIMTTPRAVGLQPNVPITIATAQIGTMYEGGKRIVMNQDAHIHRQPNTDIPALEVQSEQLIILPDENIMLTHLPVFVTRGKSHLNGEGMKYNNETRQLEVYAATHVDIAAADSQRSGQSPRPPHAAPLLPSHAP